MKLIPLSLFLFLFYNAFSQQDTVISINLVGLITKDCGSPVKSYSRNGTLKRAVYSDWNGNQITVYYRKGKFHRYKYRESRIVRNEWHPKLPQGMEIIPENCR